jgi:hypothetical protein
MILLLSFLFFIAGCVSDPETELHSVVKRNPQYTIYSCPSIYLTSKEQYIRADKQAESVRQNIRAGMDETELVNLWGRPNDIKKSNYPTGRFDTFIYESTGGQFLPIENYYFIFRDHKLESWHRL